MNRSTTPSNPTSDPANPFTTDTDSGDHFIAGNDPANPFITDADPANPFTTNTDPANPFTADADPTNLSNPDTNPNDNSLCFPGPCYSTTTASTIDETDSATTRSTNATPRTPSPYINPSRFVRRLDDLPPLSDALNLAVDTYSKVKVCILFKGWVPLASLFTPATATSLSGLNMLLNGSSYTSFCPYHRPSAVWA